MKPWFRILSSHVRQALLCVPVTRMLGTGDGWTLGLPASLVSTVSVRDPVSKQ